MNPTALTLLDQSPPGPTPPARALTRLKLSAVEQQALTGLVTGDAEELIHHVEDRATALATGDPAVRRRCLAKAAALQEALCQQLTTLLTGSIARRDDLAAALLDRALTAATARWRSIMDQLRVEASAHRRVSVTTKGPCMISAEEML